MDDLVGIPSLFEEPIEKRKKKPEGSGELSDIFDKDRKNQSIVVRITDFCNNTCDHCCFDCSPRNDNFMSLETMTCLSKVFKDTDKVCYWFNVMGGETTLHPKYEEMIEVLAGRHVRFVTNGWWINNEKATARFLSFLKTTKALMHVGVSRDKFHPKGVGDRAFKFLQNNGIDDDFGLSTPNPEDEEGSIASVGRAYYNYIGYMRSTFQAYCQSSNTRNTSFTVLEDGTVTHCPFGIWPVGKLEDGIEKLYKEKVSKVETFDKAMPTCRGCWSFWEHRGRFKFQDNYPIYAPKTVR